MRDVGNQNLVAIGLSLFLVRHHCLQTGHLYTSQKHSVAGGSSQCRGSIVLLRFSVVGGVGGGHMVYLMVCSCLKMLSRMGTGMELPACLYSVPFMRWGLPGFAFNAALKSLSVNPWSLQHSRSVRYL